jgi:uncharacterized protein (TIGR02266 family)
VGSERRQYTRVSFPKIQVRVPSSRRYREELLRDISEGGLFVSTTKILTVGSDVEIQLLPPGQGDYIALMGRVLRVEDSAEPGRTGMAVGFHELSEPVRDALRQLVDGFSNGEEGEEEGEPSAAEAMALEALEQQAAALRQREQSLNDAMDENLRLQEQVASLEARLAAAQTNEGPAADSESESPAVLERLRRSNAELETRAQQLTARLQRVEEDLNQRDQDEGVTRRLAERLAKEKKELARSYEKAREEIELRGEQAAEVARLAAELARVRDDAETTAAQLRGQIGDLEEALNREREAREEAQSQARQALDLHRHVEERAAGFEEKIARLEAEADAAMKREMLLEERATLSESHLDRSRQTERELRNLLAALDRGDDEEEEEEDPPPEASGREPVAEEAVAVSATETAAEACGGTAPETESASEETPFDRFVEPPQAANEWSPEQAPELEPVAEPGGVASEEVTLATEAPPLESPEPMNSREIAAAASTPATASEKAEAGGVREPEERRNFISVSSVAELEEHLRNGAKLETTRRFNRLEPVSRTDILVSDWLKEAYSFAELRRLARGKMSEEELLQVVYAFYQRSLVRLAS